MLRYLQFSALMHRFSSLATSFTYFSSSLFLRFFFLFDSFASVLSSTFSYAAASWPIALFFAKTQFRMWLATDET